MPGHAFGAAALVLMAAGSVLAAEPLPRVFPGRQWQKAEPADVGLDPSPLESARAYALTGEGSGYVVRHGYLVMAWGDPRQRYDLKSSTKSIGAMALGLAVLDGKVALDDLAVKHHRSFGVPPESNRDTGWLEKITLRHLATHTAGFDKPGGYTRLLFEPGTRWAYSDGGPNWLADCLTLAYRRDLSELMFERVFTPVGITPDDLRWRRNSYRPPEIDGIARREFGAGVLANVDAMARLGYLHLREGTWEGRRLLPADFLRQARTTVPGVPGLPVQGSVEDRQAPNHYGLLWWNNADGTLPGVPRDAYWSWGLYDSLIVVMPSLDLVAARAGKSWKRAPGGGHYDVLGPFLEPLAASALTRGNDRPSDRP